MKIKNGLLVCFLCIFAACNGGGKRHEGMNYVTAISSLDIDHSQPSLCFDLKSSKMKDNIYENIDSIYTIALETTDESLIGRIDNIRMLQSKIIVTDLFKSKSIYVFDMNGKFLNKIGKVGQGPGEYVSLNSIHVSNKYVDILDWISWKFIRYDLNGNFIREHLLKTQSPSDIFEYDEGDWLLMYQHYTPEHPYRLVFADSSFQIKQTVLSFQNDRKSIPGVLRRTMDGELLYYYPLCDTIYQINGIQVKPKYSLSLYEKGEVASFLENTKNLSQRDFSDMIWKPISQGIVSHYDFHVAKDFYFISYQRYPNAYISFIDKYTLNSSNYLRSDLKKQRTNFPFNIYDCYDNWLISFIDESYFRLLSSQDKERVYKYIRNEVDITRIKEIEQQPDRNPVLCFFHVNIKKDE